MGVGALAIGEVSGRQVAASAEFSVGIYTYWDDSRISDFFPKHFEQYCAAATDAV